MNDLYIIKRSNVLHLDQHTRFDGLVPNERVPSLADPIPGLEVSDSSWGAFDAAVRGESLTFDPLKTQPVRIKTDGSFA